MTQYSYNGIKQLTAYGDLKLDFWTTYQRIIAGVIALLTLTWGSVLLLEGNPTLTTPSVMAWFVALGIYVFSGWTVFTSSPGYVYFAVLVVLFIHGAPLAVLLALVGVLLIAAIRRFSLDQVLLNFTLTGSVIVVVSALCRLTGCDVAALTTGSVTAGELMPFAGMLLAGFVAGQLTYAFLVDRRGRSIGLAWQTIPFLLVLPVVMIYFDAGVFAYAAVVGLVALQILRYHQLDTAQTMLTHRVSELSVLNRVGEGITGSLSMDELLQTIYDRIREFVDVSGFYIALYDSDHDTLDYRLVDGDITTNDTDPLTRTTIEKRQTHNTGHYIGLPLMTGNKIIGVMGVMKKRIFTAGDISFLKSVAHQMSLGIRNTALYDRSVEMTEHLTTINTSLHRVMFQAEREEIMALACETVMSITGAQRVAIFLMTPESGHVNLAYSTGLTDAHRALYDDPRYLPDIGEVEVVQNVDVLDAGQLLRDVAQAGDFKGMAQVPMQSMVMSIGALLLFYERPYSVDQTHIQLLESLAHQLVSTLDNASLLRSLEDYAAEQTQLLHLSRVLNATLDLQTMMLKFSEIMQRMLNVDEVWIGFLLHEDRGYLQLFNGEPGITRSVTMATIPELDYYLEHDQPVPRICYRDDCSAPMSAMMNEYGVNTFVFVPMIANNKVQGGVILMHPTKRYFSDNEWKMLDLATNQVVVQLNNAQLYSEAQTALDRRLQQIALLQNIAQQISGARDSDAMIRSVLRATGVALQADFAALGLLRNSELRILAKEFENNLTTPYEIIQSPHTGVIGRVMDEGKVLVIPDNTAEADYIPLGEKPRRSTLIVPLKMDETVIGVLNIESREPDYFIDEHIEFARSLAGHAVVSIQNSRLLRERQSRIDTLTNLRDLSLRLAGTPDRRSVLLGILRTALDITGGRYALLYDTPDTTVTTVNGMHVSGDDFANSLPYIPDSVIREVIKTGQIRFIEDVQPDGDAVEYRSMIAAPIKRGNRIREVLCVTFAESNQHQDLDTIDLLTIQAASHLDNHDLLSRINTERDRNNAILESTRDGIIMLDRSGYLVQANHSAERLLNVDLEDFMGKHFASSLLNLQEDNPLNKSLKEMGRVLRLEPTSITPREMEIPQGNKIRYIEEVGSSVFDAKGKIMGRLLTLRDVTEEKELEAYRDEITYTIVHDLRRPLASIITGIDTINMILEEMEPNDSLDVIQQIMAVSTESANSLLNLVDTILDLAKLEEPGQFVLKREQNDVRMLAETAARHLMNSIQDADITLNIEAPEDLPLVWVDGDLILRVIRNLLDNAIRYAPQGGQVLVQAARHGHDAIIVRVADNGKGIPPGEVEHIFDKFRQAKGNIPERGGKSTGIGLTFCRQAVEAHDGKIWVEAEGPLAGACFAFTLPIQSGPAADQPDVELDTQPDMIT